MAIDQYGLELLEPAQCRELLATRRVGRIGASVDAMPIIVPVRYGLDGDQVVFRARPRTRFDKAIVGCVVCFAVDDMSAEGDFIWSVNILGEAEAVSDPADVARLDALGLAQQIPDTRWVRVATQVISGRRRRLD